MGHWLKLGLDTSRVSYGWWLVGAWIRSMSTGFGKRSLLFWGGCSSFRIFLVWDFGLFLWEGHALCVWLISPPVLLEGPLAWS